MAGVVAAKMKAKKQKEEEEAAKVLSSQSHLNYVLILILQYRIDPNWTEEEKAIHEERRLKRQAFLVSCVPTAHPSKMR